MDYALRDCGTGDREDLMAIYASTRAEELSVAGWSAAQMDAFIRHQFQAQQQHYRQHFPQSQCQLILQKGRTAGRLWLDRRPRSIHILDIALLPQARGQGLGTQCLRDVMAEAASGQRGVSIYVELHNPARRLYERLGFRAGSEPQGLYQHMAWHGTEPEIPTVNEESLSC